MHLPLKNIRYIPSNKDSHPGGFGTKRKYDIHTGVDLYCKENDEVYSIESGIIVGLGHFTGSKAYSPWWMDTDYLLIQGASGIFCYGEIEIKTDLKINMEVSEGDIIGKVIPVLKKEKIRTDIKDHSHCMLHLELYSELCEPVIWELDKPKPMFLKDPTNILISLFL